MDLSKAFKNEGVFQGTLMSLRQLRDKEGKLMSAYGLTLGGIGTHLDFILNLETTAVPVQDLKVGAFYFVRYSLDTISYRVRLNVLEMKLVS